MSADFPDQNHDLGGGERDDAELARLARAEETLRAIRAGAVDALVVTTPDGDRVFTLHGADEPYRIMLEQMSEGAASLSSDRIVLYANRRLAQMLATPLSMLVGSPIDQFITVAQHPALADLFASPEGESRRSGEFALVGHEGRRVEAQISLTPLPASTGAAWCMIATDVTERAQQLAAIVKSSVDAIIGLNSDGVIETWNPGAERLYGHSAQEAVGQHAPTLLAANAAEREQLLQTVVERADTVAIETQDVHKDGGLIEVSVTDSPIRDPDGRVIGIARTARDVTERRQADRELQRFAQAAEYGSDAVISVDPDARVQRWNRGAERLLGFSAEEAIGRSIEGLGLAVGQQGDGLAARDRLADVLAGGPAYQHETQRRRKDDTVIDVRVTIALWQVDGQIAGATSILIDLTERKRIERARERALADLQEAQRIAKLGSWSWDPSTRKASWSAQMYEIFGRDPALGAPSGEQSMSYVHPDDRERVDAAFARTVGGGPAFERELRMIAGDGVQRTVRVTGQADLTRSGCYLGTVQDITEQRQAEAERIELLETSARAESANRAKSEFLARMSHELRTPLNSIVGFTQLVELDGLTPRQREHIGYVLKAAGHLLALINEVLELERIEAGRMIISPEPVALANSVREALALVAPLARDRDVTLRSNTDGLAHDGHVHADCQRLKQVLLNLLANAIKYNRPGGRVDVSFAIADTGRVCTTIADTGIGIARDQLAKLFEPFERLGAERTDVEGTGLGLALSKGLIEAMGGTIEVDSTARHRLGVHSRARRRWAPLSRSSSPASQSQPSSSANPAPGMRSSTSRTTSPT